MDCLSAAICAVSVNPCRTRQPAGAEVQGGRRGGRGQEPVLLLCWEAPAASPAPPERRVAEQGAAFIYSGS